MLASILSVLLTSALLFTGSAVAQSPKTPLPSCEWCGATEAPDNLSPSITIAPEDEPGERLVLSGTVYKPDGSTPAEGIILYIYHTNAEGIYPKRGNETGNGRRHGYLRGWLKTGANGQYEVRTIKPGHYPSGRESMHIHMTVKEPGRPEYWIKSVKFVGDPRLDAEERALEPGDPRSGLVELNQDGDGVWRGTRDVVLRKHDSQ